MIWKWTHVTTDVERMVEATHWAKEQDPEAVDTDVTVEAANVLTIVLGLQVPTPPTSEVPGQVVSIEMLVLVIVEALQLPHVVAERVTMLGLVADRGWTGLAAARMLEKVSNDIDIRGAYLTSSHCRRATRLS